MMETIDGIMVAVQIWLRSNVAMINEERGDTNFISILILLAIVVLLATTFIGFKDTIVNNVTSIVEGFTIH